MKRADPPKTPAFDRVKHRLKQFLRRDLTAREEYLLELSEPVIAKQEDDESQPDAA